MKKEPPVNILTEPHEERSRLRSTYVLVYKWVEGKHARMNLTSVFPFGRLKTGGFTMGQTTFKIASSKVVKYDNVCSHNQHTLISFIFDTFNFITPQAMNILGRVQKLMQNHVMSFMSIDVIFKRILFVIKKTFT